MKKRFLLLTAAALMFAAPLMAEEVPQQTPYNCDYQPSCEVAPGMYGKMATPVTSKFKLSIGGFVKLDYVYNSVNLGASGALTPGSGAIPKTTSAAGKSDQSILTARQSRLWFKVDGPGFLGAKTTALIEADFYGDPSAAAESPQLRMRQAWGAVEWTNTSIIFGQAYDVFGPMVAATLDFRQGSSFGSPNNPRVPQLRFTQKVNMTEDNSLKLVFAVQDPNQDGNNNSGVAALTNSSGTYGSAVNVAAQAMLVSKALGVAPGFWGLSMNSLQAGFFGLFGSQKAKLSTGDRAVDSWGYGFYTFVPIMRSKDGRNRAMTMSFEGQAYMAANMPFNFATAHAFVGDLKNGPTGAKGYGLAGQFIFYPTQDFGITTGYERRNAYNYGSYQQAGIKDFQKYSQNVFANIAYDLNAAVRVMAEYQNVGTQYGNNSAGTSNTGTANIGRLAFLYFF